MGTIYQYIISCVLMGAVYPEACRKMLFLGIDKLGMSQALNIKLIKALLYTVLRSSYYQALLTWDCSLLAFYGYSQSIRYRQYHHVNTVIVVYLLV